MQLYQRGIRRRLAPMLDGDRRRLELAYSLLFTLPGSPVIRCGDELGMGDDLKLPERNCARTPMQWSDEPHGGFTKSSTPHLPVIAGGPYGYGSINAAVQRRHPESLLNWTERAFEWRLPGLEMPAAEVPGLVRLLTGRDIDEANGLTLLDQYAFLNDPAPYRRAWLTWRGGTDDPEAQP